LLSCLYNIEWNCKAIYESLGEENEIYHTAKTFRRFPGYTCISEINPRDVLNQII
jgi:hypothetical protein